MVVPSGGNVPLQPPDAEQVSALEAFHCSVTDVPMGTVLSLAFRVTNGGATTVGVVALLVAVPVVCAFELSPHAASEPRATNPSIDFNANANLKLRLRRIELITRLPRFTTTTFPRSSIPLLRNLRDHILIRYFDFANLSPFANYICSVTRISSFAFSKIENLHVRISSRIGDSDADRIARGDQYFFASEK